MDSSFFLFVAIAIMFVVAVVVLGYHQNQERIKQLRAVAARLGYDYAEVGAGLTGALAGFALFSRGHSRKVTNLLSRVADGTAVSSMDYRYELGAGKNRRIHRQSVLLLESERLNLPAFALHPEGLGQKLAGLLGQQDIDFEHQPDFSAAYVLRGPDERPIRALFSSEKLAFFARRPGLCIEGQSRRLIYYRSRKLVSPAEIPSFLAEGMAVLKLMAGEHVPAPAAEPDPLAGLDELLAEIGVNHDGAQAGRD